MGFMGDRSTLLETGRFVRADSESDAEADGAAQAVEVRTAMTTRDVRMQATNT